MDRKAIFHDQTIEYLYPLQPDPGQRMSIRLRVGTGEASAVQLIWNGQSISMICTEKDAYFDYYEAFAEITEEAAEYAFVIEGEAERCVYDQRGVRDDGGNPAVFRLFPGFHTPEWAQGAVMYQIFIDRFRNGDRSNDVLTDEYHYQGRNTVRCADWNDQSEPSADNSTFYGGDLQGVLEKLDYLQALGIEAIYFNPLFCSPSAHKYDTQEYEHIDPHIGRIVADGGKTLPEGATDNRLSARYIRRMTDVRNLTESDRLFAGVIEEAHKRGIRVIMDGVFNHCGAFHPWMDRESIYRKHGSYGIGAFHEKDSPYHDYFRFERDAWPDNDSYEGWWGYDSLPKLNYEGSEALCEYILSVGVKWVSAPFYADGWRLDVAADLGHSEAFNHSFWRRFRTAVKAANPQALILAEHYGDARAHLSGDEWDSVMNYDAFMEPVSWFFTGMEKHSDEYRPEREGDTALFWRQMTENRIRNFTAPSFHTAMNELSNHDHSRFLTRTNRRSGRVEVLGRAAAEENIRKEVMREAVVVQMTWPGAPTVYYGDEAGLCGYTDPDNRRPYPWGKEDQELIAFHREMIRIRKETKELSAGALYRLDGERNQLAYGRLRRRAASIILINHNDFALTREYQVRYLGIPEDAQVRRLMITDIDGYRTDQMYYRVRDGLLTITLPAHSAQILRYTGSSRVSRAEFWEKNFIRFTE